AVADAHDARALEVGMAFDDGDVRRAAEPFLDAAGRLRNDFVLARLDARHVDADRAGNRYAEVGGAARHVGGARAGNQWFGGVAAGVDARAPEAVALQNRRFAA